MFKKGISGEFVQALKNWKHWDKISNDIELFVAIRKEYVNVYYQGCSIFKLSYKKGRVVPETHYKYLMHPNLPSPYVAWVDDVPVMEASRKVLIDTFRVDLLKKSARWYAQAEKAGLDRILTANKNVIDVEVALSPDAENVADSADLITKDNRVADRIDFAAIQRKDGKPCIVFFEAKRFDNGELRSRKPEPPVIEQIRRYEEFIQKHRPEMEGSYRTVCENLVKLLPANRYDALVKDVVERPEELAVDPDVRLVVFGFDEDQRVGNVWNKHKEKLHCHFKDRFLLKGSPSEFTVGISDYGLDIAA